MPNQLLKEPFNGKYDSMVPATMLSPGSVSGGENMRKVSFLGGWKPRKGCALHNTTAAESPSAINSLHDYKNPRSEDYHFIAQCNSKLLDATNDPPASGSTFGTSLDVTVGTTPGFSCIVREDFFYADGSGRPIAWGGDNPYCSGFLAWDNSEAAYVDYFRNVTNGRTSTVAVIGNAASDVYYVGSNEIASGIKLDLTVLNTVVTTCKVYSWVAGAWSERSTGFSDGTLDSSKTHAKDGTISWTKNSSDTMHILGGIMAYWYKVEPQSPLSGTAPEASSNGSHDEEDMVDISDWIDADAGNGVSSQATYDTKSCMKLDSGAVAADSLAERNQDVGTFGDRVVVEFSMYCDALGLKVDNDYAQIIINRNDVRCNIAFASDGCLVYDGSSWTEVGTDIVIQDTWQKWTLDIDFSTPASATVDVYLDNILKEADVACSNTGSYTNGQIRLKQHGFGTSNRISYVDYIKTGNNGTFTSAGGNVEIIACQVIRPASPMSNKWNGVYEWIAGCRFYDQSATEYVEALGKISNESESQNLTIDSATTSDYLYFKTIEPASAIGLGMTTDEQNTAASLVDLIEYWNGSAWTTCGTLTDTTRDGANDSSLSQSGIISWNAAALSPQRRTFEGDQIPGYWYRMSWAVALSVSVSIFMMVYAPFPETLPTYDGCVEFKGRLILWGDPEYPNRLRFSALDRPDCFSGGDSGYTDSFGDMKTILCALPFHNELIVFKEDSVYLMEGYNKQTFGIMKIADTVGLASPKTAVVVETGSPTMHSDEPLSIAIWQDVDGTYMTDGRKPRKASGSIERYFNSEYSECIAAASIRNRQAFSDPLNNEYHFLLPAGELVYNYITDEWYPLWNRELDLVTGLALKGTNNRWFTYGGTAGGFVIRLEEDTTDKNASNTDVKITHSLKTRAISIIQKASVFTEFMLRKLWGEFKESSGNIVTTVFKNMKDTGVVESTPQAMSLTNTGYGIATPGLDLGYKGCTCFQVDFSCSVADQEMEIWTMVYEISAQGEIVV